MTSLTKDFKEIVEALQQDNRDLREIIAEQDAKLERAIYAIHQLHSGLYNQRTQLYALNQSNAFLSGTEIKMPEIPKETVNFWPTTRQGDNHEERITKLEETISRLEETISRLEETKKCNSNASI